MIDAIQNRGPAARRMWAAAAVAACAAAFSGQALAQSLPGLTTQLSVPLPKAGQYQVCLKDRSRHIGKCDSSPLIHEATLTLATGYSGGALPEVAPPAGCPSGHGAVITVREHPLGSVTASITGRDPVTRQERTTVVGPIAVNDGQTIEATACLTVEE